MRGRYLKILKRSILWDGGHAGAVNEQVEEGGCQVQSIFSCFDMNDCNISFIRIPGSKLRSEFV